MLAYICPNFRTFAVPIGCDVQKMTTSLPFYLCIYIIIKYDF